jgi:xanthine dehydrogenase molybdopterin-binding subunit B
MAFTPISMTVTFTVTAANGGGYLWSVTNGSTLVASGGAETPLVAMRRIYKQIYDFNYLTF